MYQLIINLYEWDSICKLVIPNIRNRLAKEFPMVEIIEEYTENEERPVFRGLHDGALMFEIKWLCTSVDIANQFRQRIK